MKLQEFIKQEIKSQIKNRLNESKKRIDEAANFNVDYETGFEKFGRKDKSFINKWQLKPEPISVKNVTGYSGEWRVEYEITLTNSDEISFSKKYQRNEQPVVKLIYRFSDGKVLNKSNEDITDMIANSDFIVWDLLNYYTKLKTQ